MKIKKFNSFLVFIGIISILLSLRFFSDYPKEISLFVESIIVVFERIIIVFVPTKFITFLQKIPLMHMVIFFFIIYYIIGIVFVRFFKRVVEQGTMSLIKNPFFVVKIGNIFYFMLFSITFIFIISVIGIPIAVIIFFIGLFLTFFGNLSLSVYLGYNVCQYLKMRKNIYIYYLIGSILMILCKTLYAFGLAFVIYIFPTLSLGIVFIIFYNKFILKMSYNVDLYGKNRFDRNKIRDIIKKGL